MIWAWPTRCGSPARCPTPRCAAYFAAADVYLSLSVHEGFGVPLVEAMAAGVPVVARGVGRGGRDGRRCARSCWPADDPSYVAAALHGSAPTPRCAVGWSRPDGVACRRSSLDAVAAAAVVAAVATVAGPPPR